MTRRARQVCRIAALTVVFLIVFEVLAQAKAAWFAPGSAPAAVTEGAR